jgi:glycosyltransferase involved in cell wall biosynthesis
VTDGDPLVSVIVPAFNSGKFLEETLRSAAGQTYRNLEILVVDDGSTDGSAAVAAAFAARDPRFRVLRKANGGIASARNFGIAAARGSFIAPLDHDDLWHPAKIEKQVRAAQAAPSLPGFVYCFSRTIDVAGRPCWPERPYACRGHVLNRHALLNFVGNGSALLMPRAAVLAVGGYDERRTKAGITGTDDFLLQTRLAKRYDVECLPEYLVGYRMTPGAFSSDRRRMFRSWSGAIEVLEEEGLELPARAIRWSRAERSFLLAEALLIQRQWLEGGFSLARALLLDPIRAALLLRYRLTRTVRRRLRPIARRPVADHFLACDTRAPLVRDPYEQGRAWERLARLDAGRMDWLAACDAASAGT